MVVKVVVNGVEDTLVNQARRYNIPKNWMVGKITRGRLTGDECLYEFRHPNRNERFRHTKDHPKPLSIEEVKVLIAAHYTLSLEQLVQTWTSCGYSRKTVAYWLRLTEDQLIRYLRHVGVTVNWRKEDVDGRGALIRYRVDNHPITLTEFGKRYGYSTMQLSQLTQHLDDAAASEVLQGIKDRIENSPIRRFLTQFPPPVTCQNESR